MRPLMLVLLLAGCAPVSAPPTSPSRPPVSSAADPLGDAVGRIANRTAAQATSAGSSNVTRTIYQDTGGSMAGQIGAAAVRNTASELQRWWSGR